MTDRRHFLLGGAALALTGLAPRPLRAESPPVIKGAQELDLPKPGPYDACPVCGMFPARYPEWVATILFRDKKAVHFDGPKDMFKYLRDMKKYAQGRTLDEIAAAGVTAYYSTRMIDAHQALYVIGSDVLGPMGHELVAHPDMYDASEFMKDHKGRRILRESDVNMKLLLDLDQGRFGD